MSEYVGQRTAFMQGYRAGVNDARKEIMEIERLKKEFNVSTVDQAVKDLLKNSVKE